MIIFQNPGLIDMMAVTTMGVNVKVQPGAFGQFGTGLKFGVATILRGGGSIVIYRGTKAHRFTVQTTTIRGEEFDLVCLDGEPIGITTQLGKNWEPWMVLRELGCNALDEGGRFWKHDEPGAQPDSRQPHDSKRVPKSPGQSGHTTIVVEWDALDGAYNMRDQLFLSGEAIYADDHIRVLSGTSQFLYYRGIRAYKLDKPSVLTYDVLDNQHLTEDRTLSSIYAANTRIEDALLKMTNVQALTDVLSCGDGYHETRLNLAAREQTKPSKEFLTTVAALREAGKPVLESAVRVLRKNMRREASERAFSSYAEKYQDRLQFALDTLREAGITISERQPIVEVAAEHMGDALTTLESGVIYISDDLAKNGNPRDIALELIKRWVDLKSVWTADDAVALLAPLLIRNIKPFRRFEIVEDTLLADMRAAEAGDDEAPVNQPPQDYEPEEEPPAEGPKMSVADTLLIAMDERGEEFPKRPSELGEKKD